MLTLKKGYRFRVFPQHPTNTTTQQLGWIRKNSTVTKPTYRDRIQVADNANVIDKLNRNKAIKDWLKVNSEKLTLNDKNFIQINTLLNNLYNLDRHLYILLNCLNLYYRNEVGTNSNKETEIDSEYFLNEVNLVKLVNHPKALKSLRKGLRKGNNDSQVFDIIKLLVLTNKVPRYEQLVKKFCLFLIKHEVLTQSSLQLPNLSIIFYKLIQLVVEDSDLFTIEMNEILFYSLTKLPIDEKSLYSILDSLNLLISSSNSTDKFNLVIAHFIWKLQAQLTTFKKSGYQFDLPTIQNLELYLTPYEQKKGSNTKLLLNKLQTYSNLNSLHDTLRIYKLIENEFHVIPVSGANTLLLTLLNSFSDTDEPKSTNTEMVHEFERVINTCLQLDRLNTITITLGLKFAIKFNCEELGIRCLNKFKELSLEEDRLFMAQKLVFLRRFQPYPATDTVQLETDDDDFDRFQKDTKGSLQLQSATLALAIDRLPLNQAITLLANQLDTNSSSAPKSYTLVHFLNRTLIENQPSQFHKFSTYYLTRYPTDIKIVDMHFRMATQQTCLQTFSFGLQLMVKHQIKPDFLLVYHIKRFCKLYTGDREAAMNGKSIVNLCMEWYSGTHPDHVANSEGNLWDSYKYLRHFVKLVHN